MSPTTTGSPTPVATPVPIRTTTPAPTLRSRPSPVAGASFGPHITSAPVALRIPRIGVVATVEPVGIEKDGTLASPSGPFTVGWFDGGVLPGQPGNAVIDGHVDYRNVGPAVFWRLNDLQPNDTLLVDMPDGRVLTFVVERKASYPYNDAPTSQIFGPTSLPRLNLITCTGVFDSASRNYNRRLVVYARLASPS